MPALKLLICLLAFNLIASAAPAAAAPKNQAKQTVVLVHGLARSSRSMTKLASALGQQGYQVCNINYPSTKHPIEELVKKHILAKIDNCATPNAELHFISHSMGGIIVRYIARHNLIKNIGRVVMLSPPNHGSEVVDRLGKLWLFDFINGPAGQQLTTAKQSLPNTLGAANFELGIITGRYSINPILSLLIDGQDDGKVSVQSAKLEGMRDFLVLPQNHTFIMRDETAIAQSLYFLAHGQFEKTQPNHKKAQQ